MYRSIVKTTLDTHHCTCHSSFQVTVSLLLRVYIISHTWCPRFIKVLPMYHSNSNRHQLALIWSLFSEQLSLEKRGGKKDHTIRASMITYHLWCSPSSRCDQVDWILGVHFYFTCFRAFFDKVNQNKIPFILRQNLDLWNLLEKG